MQSMEDTKHPHVSPPPLLAQNSWTKQVQEEENKKKNRGSTWNDNDKHMKCARWIGLRVIGIGIGIGFF